MGRMESGRKRTRTDTDKNEEEKEMSTAASIVVDDDVGGWFFVIFHLQFVGRSFGWLGSLCETFVSQICCARVLNVLFLLLFLHVVLWRQLAMLVSTTMPVRIALSHPLHNIRVYMTMPCRGEMSELVHNGKAQNRSRHERQRRRMSYKQCECKGKFNCSLKRICVQWNGWRCDDSCERSALYPYIDIDGDGNWNAQPWFGPVCVSVQTVWGWKRKRMR